MVALFAIVVLLVARAKLREKDAEMAAMATMMGLQKTPTLDPQNPCIKALQNVSPEMLPPEIAKLMTSGEPEVRQWSFGDKPEELTKPGVHFRTHVKVQVIRKKQ